MQDKEIRNAGLKVTAPRVTILKIFEEAGEAHMSAEAVYKEVLAQGEDIGLATVYRVLTQFESAGLLQRHHFEGGHAVYELNHGMHHDHLVCIQCQSVVEFYDELIEKRQQVIAQEKGFVITDHNHTVYGVCRKCSV